MISLSLDASKDEDSTTSGHLFLFLTTIVEELFFLNEVGRWKFPFLQFEFVSSFTVQVESSMNSSTALFPLKQQKRASKSLFRIPF